MFLKEIYLDRRTRLKEKIRKGIILILGNSESPMNYKSNQYPFRQDSSFLYFFGVDTPDLAGIIDIDEGTDTIYGDDPDLEDIIWSGYQEELKVKCGKSGIKNTKPMAELKADLGKALAGNRRIHYLAPYREDRKIYLSFLLNAGYNEIESGTSVELTEAIIDQRSCKQNEEVAEMEKTMNEVTAVFYLEAMRQTKAGKFEYEIAGLMKGIALEKNCRMAYPVICSINGHILHNPFYGNKMQNGQLLLIDAGAESPLHYATDITRTFPVSGKFTTIQKDIYNLVLKAETEAIDSIAPDIKYLDIHLKAAGIICQGLKDLGFMKGNVDDAVASGAHALFFPHGLGHMLGLDVHDMENLGEDFVGYNGEVKRSSIFGTAYLRLARKLMPGFTLTVEPGIYFIPALISKWQSEGRFSEYINYEKVLQQLDFGGIRIEDNVVVNDSGHRIIGPGIPKTVTDIENIMNG